MRHFRLILSIMALLSVITMKSQIIRTDGEVFHWEGGTYLGLNNDGFSCDLRALYFPNSHIGFKIGIGFASEILELQDWYDDYDDYYYKDNDYAMRFIFNPAIVLRTPRIVYWKNKDAGFHLFAEPGIVLSPGASGSRNASCFNWDFKTGINIQVYKYIVSIGYGISNFSLYSGRPENHWGLPKHTEYITHTVFLGAAIKF